MSIRGLFYFVLGGMILFALVQGIITSNALGGKVFAALATLAALVVGLLFIGVGISLIVKEAK